MHVLDLISPQKESNTIVKKLSKNGHKYVLKELSPSIETMLGYLMFSKKNIHEIKKMTGLIKDVVYGWGNSFEEPEWLKQIISNPKCFGKNKNKTPKHPLYLSYNHKLVNYR